MSELIDREALLDECLNHYEVGNIEQNCTMDWICKTVRNFPAAPRWVRCEERMPETMVRCLIWDGYEADTAYLIRGFHDCKSDWYWRKVGIRRSGGKIPFRVIKMWMPIEPPKEDA